MLNRESQIIQLKDVNDCINFASKSKKLVCIGVDGPTASGKTIFADLLRKEIINISNKNVQIVPLDSLLLDRTIREKSLQNIQNVDIPFEYEAEIHMSFSKFDNLIDIINYQKANLSEQKNIIIKNLYSRSDQGRCSGELKLNISNNTVLIFEGHYTTRPEFKGVLDKNFILLAKRKELIKRKIERVANYRNQEEVEAYFELIDEPSYLSNYYRFAPQNALIIDNTQFKKPFSADYSHIKSLLNTEKFLVNKKITSKKIKEFIYGLHGLSTFLINQDDDIENLLNDLDNINVLKSRKDLSNVFLKSKIKHKINYFDYSTQNEFELGMVVELFDKKSIWILSRIFEKTRHLIFWEGGVFKIENGIIEKLSFLNKLDYIPKNFKNNFWNNLKESKGFLSSTLFDNDFNSDGKSYSFLENSSRVSFFATALRYTQFSCESLGDFFMISNQGYLENKIKTITTVPKSFKLNNLNLDNCEYDIQEIKSDNFTLTKDYLLLNKELNKNIINKLEKIYFESSDIKVRKTIIEGLLHSQNKCFVPENIRDYLNFSICYLPISMSRLYVLKRMGIEETNVLAANIYDITENPIDSSAYLDEAIKKGLPTILQISQNACGQKEKNSNGEEIIGYLKPDKGIKDFTNSICEAIVKILDDDNCKKYPPPLIGIGLDHIDVRGDLPIGRSSRFVKEAIKTESITHLTLDGSYNFKPQKKIISELYKAYVDVFVTSLKFLNKINFDSFDLEFCTGELNYIGNEINPHYPDGKEMSLLPFCLSYSLNEEKDLEYKANLINTLKLYVGNLGTTHHGNDTESSLKISLAKEWQEALMGTNFVSPVLHGTTGSTDKTFSLASKSCQKINIAGSFLRILLENLDSSEKNVLGFTSFDSKSKYLCSKLGIVNKEKVLLSKKELKKEFSKYCKINDVKPLLGNNQKIRKTLYGRNKIAKKIFLKLKQMVII